jgi:RNA-directed DNA polymerase
MMHGHEKSDPGIVAMKPANKADRTAPKRFAANPNAAEPVERRAGTKGNGDQQSTLRTQRRERVPQALERIRQVVSNRSAVTYPRWEPDAGKPHVRIWAGGVR